MPCWKFHGRTSEHVWFDVHERVQGFLYSGTLNAELETLAEVMIIAEKYQVVELSMHCVLALTIIHGTVIGPQLTKAHRLQYVVLTQMVLPSDQTVIPRFVDYGLA